MPNNLNSTIAAQPESCSNDINTYYFKCYTVLAVFLDSSDAAMLIQRIHYWLQNAKSGYRLQDGSKWIFNGYKEWKEQMGWLSVQQIGRIVRDLEQLGWLVSNHFYNLKRSVGFAQPTPAFHEDNQRKWYRIDYVRIYEDTGFDLLFDAPDKSAPPQEMAETLENSQCSNLNNALFKFEHSSIYKDNTKTLTNECENKGIEFNNESEKHVEGWDVKGEVEEESKKSWSKVTVTQEDKSSAAPRNKTLKIVKQDPMFTNESRPARQNPKLRYPDGPWLTENGGLNVDFIRDRALLWRTGDTPKSQAFGRMPIEEVMALVCGYYAKSDNHANLEIHWAAYVAKNQRYLGNVKQRINAGINVPQSEQHQVLAKLPAVLSAPVEAAYERAAIHPELLPSFRELPMPTALSTPRTVLPPEDGENCQAYQNNVKREDVEWMQRFTSVQPKAAETSEEMAAAKAYVEALKARKTI